MKEKHKDGLEFSVIRKDAQEWVIKNDHGLTVVQQNEFEEWLNLDPRHRAVYIQENRNWDELDRLAGLQVSFQGPVNPDIVDDIPVREVGGWLHKMKWIAALPMVASVIFGLSLILNNPDGALSSDTLALEKIVFERVRNQLLDDGSKVMLNRGGEVSTHFNESERLVKLLEGEANFLVTKDPSRPFLVEVGEVRLRAVGTEFNVRVANDQLEVIVTEGVVAVNYAPETDSDVFKEEAILEVNQKAIIDFQGEELETSIINMQENEIREEIVWQPVVLDFENAPLKEIVKEFNRRNPLQIVIEDSELVTFELSSLFWSDNMEGFLRLLEAKFDIQARLGDSETVYLFKALPRNSP